MDGAEAAIAVTTAANPEKVPVDWSSNQRTAKVSLYRLVAKYPVLRVPRGYLRKIPVTHRTVGDITFLVLNLKASTVEAVEKRKKADKPAAGKPDAGKSGEQPEQQVAASEEEQTK
ncbi:MAG TPA: hypothetical protein VD969_07695 [Symbiobacteriaceae bacterium]|nr:hypothetical protein [Symbiobacteriaceae bacterium]